MVYEGVDGEMILGTPADYELAHALAHDLRHHAREDSDKAARFYLVLDAIAAYERDHGLNEGFIWGTA
ncbi:hypothetical protein GCM10011611_26410 [Aliidongia dinghuensis]|uniref:Uncharacterized protein n=1 Tax=Aliidongia dinghuensis TaxID=1867774 RepID=A0A8J3E543_9PROT|nr:hypothetical protein [Aliidongia dinghuensis]GGF19241.1 hypothetical protein GCM10011611_26410 [Aliidongia dinghuensis]